MLRNSKKKFLKQDVTLDHSDFDDFKNYLRTLWKSETYKNEDIKEWNDFGDIPAKECRILIALIRKSQK